MHSTFVKTKMTQRFAALTLGLVVLGAPLVSFAQGAPPPGQPNLQQAPPPPPPGAQPYPYPYPPPYPYPYAQPGQQPYGPYGYPQQQQPPKELPYNEGDPVPPGYRPEEKIRKGLVIPGAIIFGLFYLGSISIAAGDLESSRAPYGALFVPVIGPFIVVGAGNFGSSGNGLNSVASLYVIDGLLQAGGGAMLLAGILAKKKVLTREDLAQVVKPEVFVGPGSVSLKLTF